MADQYKLSENMNREEWNKVASRPNVKTHFLSSWEWGEVSKKRGWTPHYLGLSKNSENVATALLLQKQLVLGYSYFYIPRGYTADYEDKALLSEFTKLITEYCKKHKGIYFKIDPDIKLHTIDENGDKIEGEENYQLVSFLESLGFKHKPLTYFFETEQPRFTFRIPLEDSHEEIQKKYGKTTKNLIRQSKKFDVEVKEGTEENLEDFCRLMASTEKRKDFFSHDSEFYYDFYNILKKSDMVSLYIGIVDIGKIKNRVENDLQTQRDEIEKYKDNPTKKAQNRVDEAKRVIEALEKQKIELSKKPDGRTVASAYMVTRYMDKAWALYAGNDIEFSKFYPNYAVFDYQIHDSKDKGNLIFDGFGVTGKKDPTGKLNGLFDFKRKWGGEFTEFIGEFDMIINKPIYFAYKTLIPYYHKMVNKRLREKVQNEQ